MGGHDQHTDERSRRRTEEAERIEDEVEQRNPDDITKREAYEREAAERGVSDEAQNVGDVIDGPPAEESAQDDDSRR